MMQRVRQLLSPAGILVLAALVRLAFVISMGNRYYFSDTAEYEAAALRILAGMSPGESTPRAPLYPAFMALGFLVGGERNYVAVRLLQVVIGVVLVWLTGRLARRVGGPAAERPAMLVAAFSPMLVFVTGMLYPTTLYTLILTAFAATTVALAERPRWQGGALLGALVPLGLLTDMVFVAPAATLVLWLALRLRDRGAALVRTLAVATLVAATIATPWILSQRGAYSGKAAFMQKAQYVLDWSRTDPRMAGHRHVRMEPEQAFRLLDARSFVAREWRLMREQPMAYAHDVTREFLHFFQPWPDRVQTQNRYSRPEVLIVGALHFLPVLLLALLGLWRGAASRHHRLALALVVLSTALFYAFFFSQTRYRIPVEPMLYVLSALGLVRLFPRVASFLAGAPHSRTPAATARP